MALRASYSTFLFLQSLHLFSTGFGFGIGLNTRRWKARDIWYLRVSGAGSWLRQRQR